MKLKNLTRIFDKIENDVRSILAHHPVLYAMIGSIGIILLWRGIWGLADEYNMSNGMSILIGTIILLASGLFVSFFVGEQIIISGINEEQRVDEKTEEEIRFQSVSRIQMQWKLEGMLKELDRRLERLEEKMGTLPQGHSNGSIPQHKPHIHGGERK